MTRSLHIAAMWVVCLSPMARLAAEEPAKATETMQVTVVVTGEGTDKESAKADALRKAIEVGGKQEIASHSQAENFTLVHDTIVSRSEGIVVDYKITEEGDAGGVFTCKMRAIVDKKAVATRWGEVQILLEKIGRPRVMVCIQEKIDNVLDSGSILESKLEERLIKSGFDMVEKAAMEEIFKKESVDAAAENDVTKVQRIAKNFKAQVYIVGHANANFAEIADLYGVSAVFYNCDAMAKCYYTDSARLLASESIPVTRRGARGRTTRSPQAGKAALSAAGEALIEKLYVTVMQNWARSSTGQNEIVLEVSQVKFGAANNIKKRLAEMTGMIGSVQMEFSKNTASYRIKARCSGEELAPKLAEGEFEKLFDINDVTMNRIQAKGKAEKE